MSTHKTLNPRFWTGQKFCPAARRQLLRITDDFLSGIKTTTPIKPLDIYLTGSMANYNYHKLSDLDLHILLDFKKIACDQPLVKNYMHDETMLWNSQHSVNVYGYEVEVYLQDKAETLVAGGLFSLQNNSWVRTPVTMKVADKSEVAMKAKAIATTIDKLDAILTDDNAEEIHNKIQKLRDKLKKMRKRALLTDGEASVDNAVFKSLRQSGHLNKLLNASRVAYDKSMSLFEAVIEFKSYLLKG